MSKEKNTMQGDIGCSVVGMIRGTGAYVPEKILDNNELAESVDTSDMWIRERTGVEQRHIAEHETTVSMACKAGQSALEDAGVSAGEVDMILVATSCADQIFPSTACRVQESLGADRASGFDLNAACSGFLFAYNTAQAYISSGMCRTILVIGSECLSRLVDWTDRTTCILFGDGAGAVLLQGEPGRQYIPVAHADGTGGDALTCRETIRMNGKNVFQFAVRNVPQAILEVLEKNKSSVEEIDWFILHQANRRIVEAAARRLGRDMKKFPVNLQNYGNTSAASIPILLDELNKKKILKKGQKLVMAGFGAGLSWGASILEWNKE